MTHSKRSAASAVTALLGAFAALGGLACGRDEVDWMLSFEQADLEIQDVTVDGVSEQDLSSYAGFDVQLSVAPYSNLDSEKSVTLAVRGGGLFIEEYYHAQ